MSNEQPIGTSFVVLRELDGCWDNEPLKSAMFAELRDDSNSEDQFVSILDVLLDAKFDLAIEFATRLLVAAAPHQRRYVMAAAMSLALHGPGDAWAHIWELVVNDLAFGKSFFLNIAQRLHFEEKFFAGLSEDQLAELYCYLEKTFPRREDPVHQPGDAHFSGPRESLMYVRDSIPQRIASCGTLAAVKAIQWLIAKLPEQAWLSIRLLEAQRIMRMKTWSPLTPRELFALLDYHDRVLVQTAEDLSELLVSALRRFENDLHGEQNPIRALWDRQAGGSTFRPVEEDALSDVVRLFLTRELVEREIIANREVEVARIPGARIGRRTDIRVDAVRRSANGASYDVLTAVIESKGCWNDELFTALNSQLYEDYMVTLRAPVGIYLVGWFDKPKWDIKDRRRSRTPDLTLHEIQSRLDDQAAKIPQGYLVRVAVIDCHAP